ncbi:hypothetical protein GH714_023586 [Hevea brasiliensis]|uniref:Protein FAR1-RELATED SEQUENCE n=1 Tax=Hevea brasiliensis TaxID=3981 RepID=A0A6A6LIZ2_HEVBR|nr:hypothetical protein GH714_023586 [Hevea brasiliensis]
MADARSRVAYGYFSDGVAIDTTCLKDKFEMPLVSFIGANHHGHSMLLGCGLLAGMPLCFPNQNGLEEIPSEYILTRWRKDVNRSYVLDHSCGGIDTNHPVHRYIAKIDCLVRYNGKVYAINPRLFSSKIVYKSVTQLTT